MKIFLLSVLALGALLSPVHADLLPPQPNLLTVKNLGTFPQYKFLYAFERENDAPKPLIDGKAVDCYRTVQLLVQRGKETPQVWATVPNDWRGQRVTLVIDDVQTRGKTIRVIYRTTSGTGPGKKSAEAGYDSRLILALAAGGAGGLVLLERRRRPSA